MKIQPALQTAHTCFLNRCYGKISDLMQRVGDSGWGGLKNKVFWDLYLGLI